MIHTLIHSHTHPQYHSYPIKANTPSPSQLLCNEVPSTGHSDGHFALTVLSHKKKCAKHAQLHYGVSVLLQSSPYIWYIIPYEKEFKIRGELIHITASNSNSYRTVNTLRLSYTNQSVNVV